MDKMCKRCGATKPLTDRVPQHQQPKEAAMDEAFKRRMENLSDDEKCLWTVAGAMLKSNARRMELASWIIQRTELEHAENTYRSSPKVFKEYLEDAAAVLAALERAKYR